VERNGNWQRSVRYGPYGSVIADTASAGAPSWELHYRWTGREYDPETGWYFFRGRYYDPSVWRFVQEDPAGHGGGTNLFAYGDGGPFDGRDPNGQAKVPDAYNPPRYEGGEAGMAWGVVPEGAGCEVLSACRDPWGTETDEEFADLTWDAHQHGITTYQAQYCAGDQACKLQLAGENISRRVMTSVGSISVVGLPAANMPVVIMVQDDEWKEDKVSPIVFHHAGGVLRDAGKWVLWYRVTKGEVEGIPIPGGLGFYHGLWIPDDPRRYDPTGKQLGWTAFGKVWYKFGIGIFWSEPTRHFP
jgi:RHS repeat-associated protein